MVGQFPQQGFGLVQLAVVDRHGGKLQSGDLPVGGAAGGAASTFFFSVSRVTSRINKNIENAIEEIYQDVKDLLVIYQQTHMNPVHFPDEEHVLKIKRQKAYHHV